MDAAAAADVENAFALQRSQLVDPLEAQRVDRVQRCELAVGIPPAVSKVAEFAQFLRIDVGHGFTAFEGD
jgi:hypothetical protein